MAAGEAEHADVAVAVERHIVIIARRVKKIRLHPVKGTVHVGGQFALHFTVIDIHFRPEWMGKRRREHGIPGKIY